jgi:hypothetical protein
LSEILAVAHTHRPTCTEKSKPRQRLGDYRGMTFYLALTPDALPNRIAPFAERFAMSYM